MDNKSNFEQGSESRMPFSLRALATRSVSIWRDQNPAMRRAIYPLPRRMYLAASQRPAVYASLAALVLLVIGLTSRFVSKDALVSLGAGWKTGDWTAYFQTMWQVQATIVGLVYPFAISVAGTII